MFTGVKIVEDVENGVEFRSPFSHWFARTLKFVFVGLFLTSAAAGAIWGALFPLNFTAVPIWAHVTGGIFECGFAFFIFWAFDRSEPIRLIVHADHCWDGGHYFGRLAFYCNIRLIREERFERSSDDVRQFVLELRNSRPIIVALTTSDARQCFEFFRTVATHAPAIDANELIYKPIDLTFADEAHKTVLKRLRRNSHGMLVAAILTLLLGTFIFSGAYFGGLLSIYPAAWSVAVGVPLASLAFGYRFIKLRRTIRQVVKEQFRTDDSTF